MAAATTVTFNLRNPPRVIRQWDSQALATGGVIQAAPGVLLEVTIFNGSASTRYFQLFDSATVPANASVPFMCPIKIPAGQNACLVLGNCPVSVDVGVVWAGGVRMATGISWASSSTSDTKTITGVADMWVTARYL